MKPRHRQRTVWLPTLALFLSCLAAAQDADEEQLAPDALVPEALLSDALPISGVPGVFKDHILFGQSAALSGDAEELGKSMRLGLETAFFEAGKVNGRDIRLISRDDRYEPEDALHSTRKLIEADKVFALIGSVGTPTARLTAPLAQDAGVPFIAPLTGAEFLREPQWSNVVNLRASYFQETEEIVRYLVEDLALDRIAVFYQDDSFGQAGYQGATLALSRRGLEPVATTVYPRNTRAVKSGLLEVQNASPQAVIMIGPYQPVTKTVTWARKIGFEPVFMTLSFVGSNALAEQLGSQGSGVYVTQVVPFPSSDDIPVLRRYRKALARHAPKAKPGFISLEGYLAGRLAVTVLETLGQDVTRTGFLEALRSMGQIDLQGFRLSFGENNQGSNAVYLTVIDENGKLVTPSSPADDAEQQEVK